MLAVVYLIFNEGYGGRVDLATAHQRIHHYCLGLENERALAAYGRGSYVGKILEIHRDEPGRTHIVVIRQSVGF